MQLYLTRLAIRNVRFHSPERDIDEYSVDYSPHAIASKIALAPSPPQKVTFIRDSDQNQTEPSQLQLVVEPFVTNPDGAAPLEQHVLNNKYDTFLLNVAAAYPAWIHRTRKRGKLSKKLILECCTLKQFEARFSWIHLEKVLGETMYREVKKDVRRSGRTWWANLNWTAVENPVHSYWLLCILCKITDDASTIKPWPVRLVVNPWGRWFGNVA